MTVSVRTTILFIVLSLVQAMSACASQTPESSEKTLDRVTMPNTQIRQLESSATGRSYDIYVRLPDDYSRDTRKDYPVLYVLDGQWDFKLLDSIYSGLYYDRSVPEMLIVGITYSGDDTDYGALRAMDYTPVADLFISGSGDAPKFFAFLKEQLIPFIEAEYRVDPSQRVLMGSSFGGTFTLYAMFTEPALFRGYVIGSPIVTYGSKFAFQQEAEYASDHKDLPVRLFLAVGELEDIRYPVNQFTQILEARNYVNLEMETRIVEGERHASNKPETYNRGLRFIFENE